MQCPNCHDTKLAIAERQGIEIDYCPDCRGVWLDRGELDKIIERSDEAESHGRGSGSGSDRDRGSHHGDYGHHGGSHGKKRKKSLLHELLDF